ncbi:serine/threonine protein kinase, CMGC, CDC2/CDK sub [Physocladia obscura]|uniref:Serine/threonine protein kinase, CMGC, CDC2/CDK sub n=1 Tax=Physocladia obscura TaxID=109957 RepID=A0AAD5T5P4_9FUNG|nr:serine/threonine protein kinase, CMGC, CDC2/CDK sub [Physocladia obscura]
MKTANILIDNTGCLKIADFGLARAHLQSVKDPRYTNMVVTRWYRPPELLLGGTRYGPAIDVWGVGCVFGEILRRRPILIGNDDFDQLKKVIELCGTPTAESWPGLRDLPNMSMIANLPNHERSMKAMFKHFIDDRYFIGVFDLLEKIFVLDPTKRLTAAEALLHPYFFAKPDPAVVGSDDFNCKWEQSHELSSRQRRSAAAATQQQVSDLIPGMKLESQQAPLAVPPPHYTLPSDMDHYYKVMGAGSLAGQPLHNGGGVVGAGANGSGGAGGQNGDSRQRGGVQPQYEHRGQGGGRGGGGSRYTGGERYSRDGRDGRENRGGDYSGSRRDDGGGRRGGGGDDRDSRRDDKRDERRDDRRDGRDRDTAGGRDRFDGGRQTHNEGGGGGGHQRSTSHSHGLPPRPNQNQ